jgi:hypothetical protein
VKNSSVAKLHAKPTGRPPRRTRQNDSDAVGLRDKVTGRKRLLDLKHWVVELNTKHGRSFRWIAEHTTRGPGSHGYFQAIATGQHLSNPPRICPRECDHADIRLALKIVRECSGREVALTEKLFEFQRQILVLNSLALGIVDTSTQRPHAKASRNPCTRVRIIPS